MGTIGRSFFSGVIAGAITIPLGVWLLPNTNVWALCAIVWAVQIVSEVTDNLFGKKWPDQVKSR